MVLRLYHTNRDPYIVFNVVKVSIDDNRTLLVTTKERRSITYKSFRHKTDYERLTIQID